MEKKYELVDSIIDIYGHTLYRIKALRDFGDVRKGDLGGFIEWEHNLSHNGNAWVFGKAKVFEDAGVFGDAVVTESIVYIGGLHFPVTITDNVVIIGCQANTLEDWLKMPKEELEDLDPNAIRFYEKYKNLIKTLVEEHQKRG